MPEPETLLQIKTSFRGREKLIDCLYSQSEEFQSLCTDYCECAITLDRWRQRDTAEALLRQEEYSQLLIELDREIEAWLQAVE